jgi:hypothetical protein
MFANRTATVKCMSWTGEISFDWVDGESSQAQRSTSVTLHRSRDKHYEGGLLRWGLLIEHGECHLLESENKLLPQHSAQQYKSTYQSPVCAGSSIQLGSSF